MKKILMGLVALSATTVFGIDLGTEPQNNSVIFNTEQVGKIPLRGSLISREPGVKFVIFASTTGTYGPDSEDTLNISKVVLTQKVGSNIVDFGGTPSKVYVKKVVNGQVQDLGGEAVKFVLGLDEEYTNLSKDIEVGNTNTYGMTALFSKSKLQGILDTAYRGSGFTATASSWGEFSVTGVVAETTYTYRTANQIAFEHESKGVLKIDHRPSKTYGNVDTLPLKQAKLFEEQLVSGVPVVFPIYVTVN